MNSIFSQLGSAGNHKNITIDNDLHSYPCLQITFGADLYSVSKFLEHSSLKTKHIYVKNLNLQKIAAANKYLQLNMC